MRELLFLNFLLITFFGLGQTGPGGVGSSSNNVFWYDVDRQGAANNTEIEDLIDFSGNGNTATNGKGPTCLTNQLNGRSVMDFNGIDEYLKITNVDQLDNDGSLTWMVVSASSSAGAMIASRYSNMSSAWGLRHYNSTRFYSNARTSSSGAGILFPFAAGYQLHTNVWDNSAPSLSVFRNSSSAGSNTTSNGTPTNHISTVFGRNAHNGNAHFPGSMAEIIVFTDALNTTERIITENYLAAKYDLTISNDKYAHQANHGSEVVGIGQESAADNHTDAQGSSIVRINSANDLEDGEYMLWGHDEGGTGNSTSEIPAAYVATGGQRLIQEWRVDISGGDNTVGTVNLTFDLTDIGFGFDPQDYRLLLDSDGNFNNSTIDPTAPIVLDSSITFSGVTLTDGIFFTIGNSNDTSTCFNLNSGNWQTVIWDCGSPPDSTNNVIISNGTVVNITTGSTESALDLTIEDPTGSLLLDPNSTLIVKGDLDVQVADGLSMADGSRIIFRGVNGNQTISNATGSVISFANLEIDNINGVTLNSGDYEISENLDLLFGNLTNNGVLTFLSTSGNTAAIGTTPNNNIIDGTGSFKVQRFRSTRNTNWGDIASSGVDTDLEDLNGEVFMSGIAGGNGYAFETGGGSFTSIYLWNESTDLYEVPASTSEPFEIGRGYEIWLGSNQTTWNDQAWELEGDIDLSPISISVSSSGGGWNLLGNPYLGFLNFDNIVADGGISGSEYWYVDANTSTFISVSSGGATIPPGQGFWVNTTGISSIDLDPALDLVSGVTSSTYLKRDISRDELRIMAHHTSEPYGSAVYLRRDENAYEGLDRRDLSPLRLPDPSFSKLSIEAGDQDLMVNYIPSYSDQIEIPIRFDTKYDGDYELSFEGLETFEGYTCVSIKDEATSEITPILDESVLTMSGLKVNDELSYTLILSKDGFEDCAPPTLQSETLNDGLVNIWNDNSLVKIDFSLDKASMSDIAVYDVLGNIIYTGASRAEFNRVEIPLRNQSSGVYFVSVNINGQIWTQKIVKY
jgi:hypothetical protein